jgi:hypothetical protein
MRTGGGAILLLAAILRLLRAGVRWEEWSLHYAAYNLPTLEALLTENYAQAITTWAGLHPPLYPLLHSMGSLVWPAPASWLLFSVAASLGAVGFMLAAHPRSLLPALLLATDPVQLHYAAEVNNYPLSVLVLSYSWWALRKDRPIHLALSVVLGFWTHLLAGGITLLVAAWHPRRWLIFGAGIMGALPLFVTAWELGLDTGSRKQPSILMEDSVRDAVERFTIGWIVMLPLLLLGVSSAKEAATTWAGAVAAWLGLVALGFAAPHQFPYACMLGVFAAALLGGAAERIRSIGMVIWMVALVRGLWGFGGDAARVQHIVADLQRTRAIDTVLGLSLPGDAIVLVRGQGPPDDDKRRTSPTLWRFSPFEPMQAIFTRVRPDLVGQPRLWRGRRLYTFSNPRQAIAQIAGDHVFTILYDGAQHNPERIEDHPGQGPWQSVGTELWRGPSSGSLDSEATTGPADAETDGSQLDPPPEG